MKTNENTQNASLLRLPYEVAGVTTPTLAYVLGWLNPKAFRRITRGGKSPAQTVQENATNSFCSHEPVFTTRAEAQARADARNKAEVGGAEYFRVLECWAVPVRERAHVDFARLERDLKEDYWADCELLGGAAAQESDAFARRVMGMYYCGKNPRVRRVVNL